MAATKTRTSIWASQTLTASAGDTTSSTIDLSGGYGALVNIKLTNGGTGPTVAAQVQVYTATNYNGGSPTQWTKFGGALVGATANSAVREFAVDIPIGAAALKLVAGSNTGQNVTVDADIANVTAL